VQEDVDEIKSSTQKTEDVVRRRDRNTTTAAAAVPAAFRRSDDTTLCLKSHPITFVQAQSDVIQFCQ